MEAKRNKSTEVLSSNRKLPDVPGSGLTPRASESNISEEREATKTILEDVCTDFESMDVINPKSNKLFVIKKQPDSSLTNTGKRNSKNHNVTAKAAAASGKRAVDEVATSNSSPVVNEVLVDTLQTAEINTQSDVASVSTDIQSVQESDTSNLNLDLQSNPETLPSNDYQNSSNITVLSESFAGEEHIPLAQLADAEIVQSGDNVSIIVTNTRLIKVLTNANNSENSVIDSSVILETSGSTTEQLGIIDTSVLTDGSFQSINILDDSSVISEAVISDSENLVTPIVGKDSQLTEDQLNALRKHSTPRGRPSKKNMRRSYTEIGPSTKARRITAKMKAEWAKQLETTGRLICQMPGCSQTYVTVANFQTHYKYCTGKKSLQHCLYCDSLIFSSHKAVLHHMEVEHPEKVEEYKAQFPEETIEFEENSLPPHLIVAEDENVAMNVEEVTQQPLKTNRKRKLSSKENLASKKHCILKNKMQSIQNSVTENIKEFKKCVRFGDIVEKINSVDIANSLELPTDNQNKSLKNKKERRRVILTESIVAEKKYFEDDEDMELPNESNEDSEIDPAKLNTKARMLLNMERYKRYKEYLKLTRDWSSERRTYSRSRTSDTSFDSSYLMALQNEYIQDMHQLNDTAESSSISLNTSETEIIPNVSYLEAFEAFEASHFASPVVLQSAVTINEPPVPVTNEHSLVSSNELNPPQNLVSPTDKGKSFEPAPKREKSACYNRVNFSNVQIKNEALKPKPKFEGIITYGMTVPGPVNKSIEPVVTFDSLISSMPQKQDRNNSSDKRTEVTVDDQNNSLTEDGTKQSGDAIVNNLEPPKKKRGRPPKAKPDQQKTAGDSKIKIEKDVKKSNVRKFSTAVLKSIEKNVKKRHAKLFGMKKKFKANSRKSGKKTHLHSRQSNVKSIQRNQLKRKLISATNKNIQRKGLKHSLSAVNTIISKEEMLSKGDSVDESVIQCQENIDNHLPLGNESGSSHIPSLVTEHNYSHIINSVIEDNSIADANNVATEIEIVTSSVENALPLLEEKQNVESSTEKVIVDANVSTSLEADHSEENQQEEVIVPENSTTDGKNVPESKKDHAEFNEKSENASAEVISVVESTPVSGKLNQSDTNEKAENTTPEIKVKRPRGRPRKNQNKESILDVSSSLSPLQDTPVAAKADETEGGNTTKSLQSEGETPNSAGDKDKSTPVRKSERVKRRKVVGDEIFESPKVEAKKKEEETVLVIRTGRRGRPRKIYPTDSNVNVSSSTTPPVAEKCPENESGPTEENLRKFSRKGRPRKCVRYADLNSGVDSSESLDGLNSTMKDKTEIPKTKGDKNKKVTDSDHGGKDNSKNNNSYAQDEAIVLPLKKRKQRQSKKEDSLVEEVENDHITKDTADSESIIGEEEKIKKMESDSEDAEMDDKKVTRSRNLRNSKNAKVSPRKKRIRHDSSDLEAELSSYITNRNNESYTAPVTRRKSSNVDNLEVEDQNSDIERNESDISYRKESAKRLNDSSLINRRVSARSVARSKELKNAVLKDSFQSTVNVLPDFKPQKYSWKLLFGKDYYDFSPPIKYSPYFKVEKTWTGYETGWTSLSIFDSIPIDSESCHGTFFTGGPVLCSAWCPTPADDKVQYVALAISCCLDEYHAYSCTDPEKGLLQLWNVGRLHNKTLESRPVMELCIAHNYGVVTEMAWCPSGCWEDPSSECSGDVMPRLGMLAVACSDSNVRIYSIPHPTFISDESSFPIYESHPSIVLQPMYGEICCVTRKSMCISLSWQKFDNCERVAAGYGNGMICIWRINTSATILTSKEGNQTKISPFLVFNAHGTPVTSVCFAPLPGGRFLVSSSSDKTLKFWDLTDISLPFFSVKKGAARSAEWAQHYCGAFASLDHGMNCFKGSSFFKECGTENFPSRLLSNPSCFVLKSTMSEFLNAQAIADMSGSVSVSFTHSLLQEHVKSPQYFHRHVYLTETVAVGGIIEKIAFSSYPESIDCITTIQEMKDIVSVMSKMTSEQTGKRKLDINSQIVEDEENSVDDVIADATALESAQGITCLNTIQELKNVVSVLLEMTEKCENSSASIKCDKAVLCEDSVCKENEGNEIKDVSDVLNEQLSEVADIVTVVTDMRDITLTVDELAANIDDSSQERNICSSPTKPTVDGSPEISLMEIEEESGSEPVSCLQDQIPLIPDKEFNRSMNAVVNLCSESVACISTISDVKEIVSIMNEVSEKCEKNYLGEIGLESNKSDTFEDAGTRYKCSCQSSEFVSMADSEKPCSCSSVTSVIQRMKDVVCFLSGVVNNCNKEANAFEGASYATGDTAELLKMYSCQSSEFVSMVDSEKPCSCSSVTSVIQRMKGVVNNCNKEANVFEGASYATGDTAELLKMYLCQSSEFVSMVDSEKPCSCSSVTSVIQRMKDVVCFLSGVVNNCNKEANAFEGASYATGDTAELLKMLNLETEGERKDEKRIVQGIGLPFELSELTDVVETVMNLSDITVTVDNLMNGCEEVKSQLPCVSELNVTDLPAQSTSTDSIIHSCSEQPISVPSETAICAETPALNVHSDENILQSEASAVLGNLIDFISENANNDLEIKCLLSEMISDIEDKLNERQKSTENILEQEVDGLKSINVSNELISAKPSPELSISIDEDIQCNNVSPVQSFNEKQLDVLVADEPMLSADSESSSSENEMDSDDELEVVDSYVYDEKSGFSDDSYMSECSLDSNISMCSYSCESDMSENSVDSIPGDQEVSSSVLCSSSQNEIAEESNRPLESPLSTLDLISEIPQNLPCRENDESKLLSDNSTANLLDSQDAESKDDQSKMTLLPEDNVPSSACQDTATLVMQPGSEEPSKIDSLDISETSNKMPPETFSVSSESSVAENSIPLHSEDSLTNKLCINSTLSTENSCDINSSCTEVSENIVNTPCTENTNENIADQDDIYVEKTSQIDSNVLPKIVEKNIFDSEKVSEAVNSDLDEVNEANASIPSKDSATVVDTKSFSPGSLSSYDDVISQYGLVFKDMNTAQFESVEDTSIEEGNSLDQYHLASIKTIAWNPNFGSHFWLFSGGQSGIARISYVSDINECKSSKSREGKDA